MEAVIKVEGMSCGHCKKAIETAVSALQGVRSVDVHLEAGEVNVDFAETEVNIEAIHEAIEAQGYDVVK